MKARPHQVVPLVSLVATIVLLAAGCGGTATTASTAASAQSASLALAPSYGINFGSEPLNIATTRSARLTNSGSSTLTVDSASISGATTAFQLLNFNGPFSLLPGATYGFLVSFTPSADGNFSATLMVGSGTATKSMSLSGTGTAQGIGVTVSPDAATLQTGTMQQFTASVVGTSNTTVDWLVNNVVGGNSTVGTITSSGVYTAPASVPAGTVTVSAQSAADTTKFASGVVTVVPPTGNVTVVVSPASTKLSGGQSQAFTATVTGTNNTQVNWLVNGVQGGNGTTGTISSSGLYAAPACPSQSSVTVTAVSVYDPNASDNATVTLSGGASGNGNYYVATNGSDSNNGSACSPWATITHAAGQVGPGATVHVASGTYNENVSTSVSGTSSSPITFVSDTQWGAKIVGSGDSIWLNSGAYVTIEGFDISASNTTPRLGILSYGQYVRIIGNKVHDIDAALGVSGSGGAAISPNNNGSVSSDYTVVDSNIVYNIANAHRPNVHVHGIYINGSKYDKVSNNLVINTSGWGIVQDHPGVGYMTAVNNTVVNCDGGIEDGNTSGGAGSDYNYIANNIVVHNTAYYAYEDCCSSTNVGSHNTWTNNLDYDTLGGTYRLYYGSPINRVTADPVFVDNTLDHNGDYHLLSSSPAINVGTSTNAPQIDIEGGVRPISGAWDLGAYEYGSGTGTWPF